MHPTFISDTSNFFRTHVLPVHPGVRRISSLSNTFGKVTQQVCASVLPCIRSRTRRRSFGRQLLPEGAPNHRLTADSPMRYLKAISRRGFSPVPGHTSHQQANLMISRAEMGFRRAISQISANHYLHQIEKSRGTFWFYESGTLSPTHWRKKCH